MDLTTPTVFIVDDDAHLRQLMRELVESIGVPVEAFSSAADFLRAYVGDRPGCLVTDVRMPGMSGLDLQSTLAQRGLTLPVIVVTAHGDLSIGVRAMKAQAVTVLSKPFHSQDFIDSVQQALRIDEERRRQVDGHADVAARLASLSNREREILKLITDGLASKQIALRLELSEKTIESYRAQLMKKLNVNSLAKLVRFAIEAGIVSLEGYDPAD
jgi:FixJ family two-component response regulator